MRADGLSVPAALPHEGTGSLLRTSHLACTSKETTGLHNIEGLVKDDDSPETLV